MEGNNDESDDLQLTEEEGRVIREARAAGLSPAQMLDRAKQDQSVASDEANKSLTRGEVDALLEKRDQRDSFNRARLERVRQVSEHIGTRLAANSRLKGKDRRVGLIQKQAMDRIGETPSLVDAKTGAEFYDALDKLVDDVAREELADIDEIAGAQSQADLDETLDAESEGGPGTGGSAGTAQGDDTPTPAGEVDWAENPVHGLGVEQPSEVDLEQAFQRDMKRFGKKHGMRISA